jgi:ferredoxin
MAFTIEVDEQKIKYLDGDKNILNGLERENIESQFHCRDGFCGACRCTLLQGTVDYQQSASHRNLISKATLYLG